jgi:hypothetical protein
LNHSEDCDRCDGSGFVAWYDESADCKDEDNCDCRYAETFDDLCGECVKVNADA